jgi:hypothetical protein
MANKIGITFAIENLAIGGRRTVTRGYVGIDLEQIRFPAGVKLLCSKDLRDRYLEGLKSDNGEIRGHAVGGLGELARFTACDMQESRAIFNVRKIR